MHGNAWHKRKVTTSYVEPTYQIRTFSASYEPADSITEKATEDDLLRDSATFRELERISVSEGEPLSLWA